MKGVNVSCCGCGRFRFFFGIFVLLVVFCFCIVFLCLFGCGYAFFFVITMLEVSVVGVCTVWFFWKVVSSGKLFVYLFLFRAASAVCCFLWL